LHLQPEEHIILIVVSLDGDKSPELYRSDRVEKGLPEHDDLLGRGHPLAVQQLKCGGSGIIWLTDMCFHRCY